MTNKHNRSVKSLHSEPSIRRPLMHNTLINDVAPRLMTVNFMLSIFSPCSSRNRITRPHLPVPIKFIGQLPSNHSAVGEACIILTVAVHNLPRGHVYTRLYLVRPSVSRLNTHFVSRLRFFHKMFVYDDYKCCSYNVQSVTCAIFKNSSFLENIQ